MPKLKCEVEGVALLLRGSFNPSIVQPYWLAYNELIRKAEAENAEVEIVRPELSIFKVGDLKVTVAHDSFQIESTSESSELVRDLAIGVFHLLEHTPIQALGFNRGMHFKKNEEDLWSQIEHKFTPTDIWKSLLESPVTSSVLIESKQSKRNSQVYCKVEPSVRVIPGLYIGISELYKGDIEQEGNTQRLISAISDSWQGFQHDSRALANTLLKKLEIT